MFPDSLINYLMNYVIIIFFIPTQVVKFIKLAKTRAQDRDFFHILQEPSIDKPFKIPRRKLLIYDRFNMDVLKTTLYVQ